MLLLGKTNFFNSFTTNLFVFFFRYCASFAQNRFSDAATYRGGFSRAPFLLLIIVRNERLGKNYEKMFHRKLT